ncbi:MAG: transposase [Deltaproteobacteria bacterium]|nr:transposase [Deltaproteobacteria bacterium]
MKFNPDIYHRQSIRLKNYDYSRLGAYFVTVCTWRREHLFGRVRDGIVELNEYGKIVADEWSRTSVIRAEIELDTFVVMPNHFHGIFIINNCRGTAPTCPIQKNMPKSPVRNAGVVGMSPPCPYEKFGKPVSGALGTIMGHFKSIVTKRINTIRQSPGTPVWQRNYHEHIIRDELELDRIRQYVANNPQNWDNDPENLTYSNDGRGMAMTCPLNIDSNIDK